MPSSEPEGAAIAELSDAEEASREYPLFRGLDQVLGLIRKLYRRPRFGEHSKSPDRSEVSKGLPMLCLVRSAHQQNLLPAISERMKNAVPHRVPHAFVDNPASVPDPERGNTEGSNTENGNTDSTPKVATAPIRIDVHTMRDLLATIAEQLNDSSNAHAGRIQSPG